MQIEQQPAFRGGDFVLPVGWPSVIMPPASLENKVLQMQLESFGLHLKVREFSFLFLEAVSSRGWLDCFVGSWASFGFPWDRWDLPFVFLSSSTTRCHFLDFPPSLCTDNGPCLLLVHSAFLAIAVPVCSCSLLLLLPSHFSRWSLVWFRYPVAFTRWCFGCSRGKQVSILCFYYFPD